VIGVDIVCLDRIKDTYEQMAKRLLSERENVQLLTYVDKSCKISYVAGRFAAKEAYVKASGNKAVNFKTVEILDDEDGEPHIFLEGNEIGEVSIAHDGYAIAFVNLTQGEK